MDRQRILFYGFIIGATLMVLPIPMFFFWRDVSDVVDAAFDYLGFILFVVCGVPLIKDILKTVLGIDKNIMK
ncbi:hypothetical protein [Mesobacillus subterraneus]|uniref:Uncharacterized protein n=1 Tax=Mesobacillus subterraneus TaxID=285983 RepID=A0A3R9E8V7_9BACI|nr:hypothetical protein [Mesobacillus subterraneus]RSD28635.1 hypothetical protein EJA10_03405 [Mesobacillus subterraneus]